MYRFWKKLHLWLSIPFGAIISLICITGIILLFQPPHTPGSERSEFFTTIMQLHRWLMDVPPQKGAMTTGKMIVGITTIAMLIITISGIVLWWIKASHGLKRSLRIITGKGMQPLIYSFHSVAGIYAAIILLLLAATGLTWSFSAYREVFNALFGIEKGSHIIAAIHTGGVGGIITKIIWGACSLTGFTLPITGYYMWLRRKNSQRQ